MSYDDAVKILRDHFAPVETQNEWRMTFQNRTQMEHETFSSSARELVILCSKGYY